MRPGRPFKIPGKARRPGKARKIFIWISVFLAGLLPLILQGCQIGYLWNQALGMRRVTCGRVKIDDELLGRLQPERREKLKWVARVLDFASADLGLDPGDSYTTYYDTGGAPITTIVVASHPYALIPYRWHFPFAGTVPYKGFFDPEDAGEERDRLLAGGWDAAVLPVSAFSSLGWFSDPVLSTMLDAPRGKLAEILIHEITHRTIYFPDHSELNESLATVVGREGAETLLRKELGENSGELRSYRNQLALEDFREEILDRLQGDLDALYRSRLPLEEKVARKGELFETASGALGRAGIKNHLEPSNATLVLERQYRELVPPLRFALARLGGDPRELVEHLKKLGGTTDPLTRLLAQISNGEGRESKNGGEYRN